MKPSLNVSYTLESWLPAPTMSPTSRRSLARLMAARESGCLQELPFGLFG